MLFLLLNHSLKEETPQKLLNTKSYANLSVTMTNCQRPFSFSFLLSEIGGRERVHIVQSKRLGIQKLRDKIDILQRDVCNTAMFMDYDAFTSQHIAEKISYINRVRIYEKISIGWDELKFKHYQQKGQFGRSDTEFVFFSNKQHRFGPAKETSCLKVHI